MRHSKCTCGHKQYEHDGPNLCCGECICMYFERRIMSTETYDILLAVLAIAVICLLIAGLGFTIGAISNGTL